MCNRMRPPHQAPHHQPRVYSYAEVEIGEMSENCAAEKNDREGEVERECIECAQVAHSLLKAVPRRWRWSMLGGTEIYCGNLMRYQLGLFHHPSPPRGGWSLFKYLLLPRLAALATGVQFLAPLQTALT